MTEGEAAALVTSYGCRWDGVPWAVQQVWLTNYGHCIVWTDCLGRSYTRRRSWLFPELRWLPRGARSRDYRIIVCLSAWQRLEERVRDWWIPTE